MEGPGKFQARVAAKQLADEAVQDKGIIFLDRSFIHGLAYCVLGNIPAPESVQRTHEDDMKKGFLSSRLVFRSRMMLHTKMKKRPRTFMMR